MLIIINFIYEEKILIEQSIIQYREVEIIFEEKL